MAPRARNNRGRGRRNGGRAPTAPVPRGSARQSTFNPSTITTTALQRQNIRFRSTGVSAGTPVAVTRACLLSLMCTVNTAGSTVLPLYSSVRLRRLVIWNNVPGDVSIDFASDLGEDRRFVRSYIGGPPTAMVITPPRLSRSAMWSRFGASQAAMREVLFSFAANFTTDSAFLIDVELEYTLGDGTGVNCPITGGLPVNSQGILFLPLDTITTTNTIGGWSIVPVGVETVGKPTAFSRSDG